MKMLVEFEVLLVDSSGRVCVYVCVCVCVCVCVGVLKTFRLNLGFSQRLLWL